MQPSIGMPIGLVALVLSVSGTLARDDHHRSRLAQGQARTPSCSSPCPPGSRSMWGRARVPGAKSVGVATQAMQVKASSPSAQLPPHALPPAQSTRRPPRSCRSIRPIPIVRWYFDIPPYTANRAFVLSRSPFFPSSDNYTADVDLPTTVAGRFGYARDKWLATQKPAWPAPDIELTLFDHGTPVRANSSDWANCWTVGGGGEYAICKNFSLGVEYD